MKKQEFDEIKNDLIISERKNFFLATEIILNKTNYDHLMKLKSKLKNHLIVNEILKLNNIGKKNLFCVKYNIDKKKERKIKNISNKNKNNSIIK